MARWDPFEDGFRIVERFGGRFRGGWPFDDDATSDDGAFTPPADVFETREGLFLEVELPGVSMHAVSVTLNAGVLTVEAERPFTRAGGRDVLHLEGRWGRMRRSFELPMGARPDDAMAELKAGVLRIFVPRGAATARVERRLPTTGDDQGQTLSIH